MKKIISLALILCLIIINSNIHSYAMNQNVKNISLEQTQEFTDNNGNLTKIIINNVNDEIVVEVYVNGVLDHITKRGINSNEILLIEKNPVNLVNTNVKKYYVNDFITEETSDKSNDNIQIGESEASFILSDYENPPSTPPGYQFVTSVFSTYHNERGYLFQNPLGEINRYDVKRIQFSAGTAVGVFVSAIASIIIGPITLTLILAAMGTAIVADNIASYVNSEVWFSNHKTLYKGFCRQIETLNTFQILKYNIIYSYKNQVETITLVGYADGYNGYNGSVQDMAYSAVVNYFN